MSDLNLTVIVDNIGRTILGKKILQDEKELQLENAAILYVAADEENKGRLSVQMVPLFFREFLGDKEAPVVSHYKDSQYTTLDISSFDERMINQYSQTFAKIINNKQTPTQEPAKIVNLFKE